jgi:hypothetical protein
MDSNTIHNTPFNIFLIEVKVTIHFYKQTNIMNWYIIQFEDDIPDVIIL